MSSAASDPDLASASTRVLMLVFDEMELLDFAGPYEVFTTAARVHARRTGALAPRFTVCTASMSGAPVRARAGARLLPDHALADAPACDWLLVPGGVVDALLTNQPLLAELRRRATAARRVASVCTGAFVLAQAGLLQGQSVTTHWEDAEDLARRWPDLQVLPERRWIDNGHTLTSAGIAAGIDMSLHLLACEVDMALAAATARQMDTPWPPA